MSLVHGEGEAIQGLRDKLYSKYPITCPQNKEFIEVTDHPEWVSSSQIERIRNKSVVDVDIQITESGIELDAKTLRSERWQAFIKGEHTATIKGNRLIIRKVQ